MKVGGHRTPVSIPRWRRETAVKLWRRGLLEVWFRKSLDSCAARGPFFSLTIVGARLAVEFLNPAPRGSSVAEMEKL
jgi:hypothetical protein